MAENYENFPWRVGQEEPRAIYAIMSQSNSIDQPMIGVMDSARLAGEAVHSHNIRLSKNSGMHSYVRKEQLIRNLNTTLELWKKNDENLEKAILEGFGQSSDAKQVFEAVGFSATVLGPDSEMPVIIQHAIDVIKNS